MSKTVCITGGSRGIGQAAVLTFAAAGYRVAFSYLRDAAAAEETVRQAAAQGGTVLPVRADVADAGQVEALFRQIHSSFGGTDILVNNAGVASQKLLMDLSEAEWDRLMDVDLKGVFLCCRAALPYMVSKKHGVIINISSMWGQTGGSCEAAYSAAKAGVIGLTKALAKEMGPSHIRVNCIAPGVIATDMNAALTPADLDALREETPLQALGRPEDVARAALFLASSDAAFITGQVLGVNGGIVM
ncbi:MAG: SDR family oxidoreductase [Clostridiales bacterium]|nr:SDR family oxidoreductase [Clostridiales bacterium]